MSLDKTISITVVAEGAKRLEEDKIAPNRAVRAANPDIRIGILTLGFRGKGHMERALEVLAENPPDVFNHNLETVRELYPNVHPGTDCDWSLTLLQRFKAQHADIPTKSGIMLGLGETAEQVHGALNDPRAHAVDMVTIGQYLQPTPHHHPVLHYWSPAEFEALADCGHGRASSTSHRDRWCAVPTTPTAWPTRPATSKSPDIFG